jgi:hypothetical protein
MVRPGNPKPALLPPEPGRKIYRRMHLIGASLILYMNPINRQRLRPVGNLLPDAPIPTGDLSIDRQGWPVILGARVFPREYAHLAAQGMKQLPQFRCIGPYTASLGRIFTGY